ncbi:ribonuclease M5 [Sporomusa acidovorans]|uniref:Ribonuclease M5 n=1 Tax=Sporomusa acidovorans (strain ATCC 49682 / DSM 3132 / Mol) TaxID=1123286 RepID=A0ABZ3IWV4_SPOA4|nr:ribonuclease M5 [Sporomusa acidovorans]OZC14008.1 ribonuclease M5 [Sporomusa acidovorans DSM 3132]SDF22270.1 ribonuclease M5 [Sporomusa acidovorans]
MIKEVIVVEGKQDIAAVKRAVDVECIATEGFNLLPRTLSRINDAYKRRGIIILTDPDSAGERIRKYLAQRFPEAKHAFVPREQANANNDIGIEQASPAAIREALNKVRLHEWQPSSEFSWQDMIAGSLTGVPDATARRASVGKDLGIGYANAKSFLYRLNHYGITRAEFTKALHDLDNAAGIKQRVED